MNIGEIIGEYVYLKPLGEDFGGRCPFCLHPQHNMEHRVTKRYIERHGPEKVRGGNYLDACDQPGEYIRYPKRFSYKHGLKAIS